MTIDQSTINTILLLIVTALISVVGKIFWNGIANVREQLGHMAVDVSAVKSDMGKLDTWRIGRELLDEERRDNFDRRLTNVEVVRSEIQDSAQRGAESVNKKFETVNQKFDVLLDIMQAKNH